MRKPLSIISVVVVVVSLSIGMLSSAVSAATLNIGSVKGTMKLLGASDVLVGTTYYDVTFYDGQLPASYYQNGHYVTDFTSEEEAILASQALLDHVFVDGGTPQTNFDSRPELTNGIYEHSEGYLYTPYGFATTDGGTEYFLVAAAINSAIEDNDMVTVPVHWPYYPNSTSINNHTAWALWEESSQHSDPVPEPATILLVGIGLGGIGVIRRKLKVRQVG